MKKRVFNCEVTTVVNLRIEVDEDEFNPEFMADFRKSFYKFDDLKEHIEHIARNADKTGYDQFLEGYGYIKERGEYSYAARNQNDSSPNALDKMNINIIHEDEDVEVDVTEVKP